MASSPKFCSNCGRPVSEGEQVCPKCGARLLNPWPGSAQQKSSRWPLVLLALLGAAGLLVLACVVLGVLVFLPNSRVMERFQPAQPTVWVEQMTEPPAAATQVVATVEMPTQPPAVETPAPLPSVTPPPNAVFMGVGFNLNPSVAAGINGEVVPASPPSQDGPYWDVAPEYKRIKLVGYAQTLTFHEPSIYIYPVEEYAKMSEQAANTINELRGLLEKKPAQVDRMPFLPVWNAGQVFHAEIKYMNFKSGSGVRYLSQYAQAVVPINSHELFYTFQGLSGDGRYYIAAVLPVSHPNLPQDGDIGQQAYQQLESNYTGYMAETTAMLEAQPPESFKPGLQALDALIESLEIQ